MGREDDRQQGGDAADDMGVAHGLATFAGAIVELPAVRSSSLTGLERTAAAGVLEQAWDLVAFTEVGACLVEVVDAAGARIELVGGVPATWGCGRGSRGGEGDRDGDEGGGDGASIPRVTSHGAVRAAWGAPPGRRIAAMGTVEGPGGSSLRLSVGLVLRLPAAAVVDPLRIAASVAFHAAMHAAERRAMPAPPRLASALDHLERLVGAMPRRPRGRVGWADAIVDRVVAQLGGIDALTAPPLRAPGSEV